MLHADSDRVDRVLVLPGPVGNRERLAAALRRFDFLPVRKQVQAGLLGDDPGYVGVQAPIAAARQTDGGVRIVILARFGPEPDIDGIGGGKVDPQPGAVAIAIGHVVFSEQRVLRRPDASGNRLVVRTLALPVRELQRHVDLVREARRDLSPDRVLVGCSHLLKRPFAPVLVVSGGELGARREPVIGAQLKLVVGETVGQVRSRYPKEHVGRYRGIGIPRRLIVALVVHEDRAQPQPLRERGGELEVGVERVRTAVERACRQRRNSQPRIQRRGGKGLILRHAAPGDVGADAGALAELVARRGKDLVELVVRRERELARERARRGRHRKRVLPRQGVIVVAKPGNRVGELRLQPSSRIGGRYVHLIGMVFHRLDQPCGIDEKRACDALRGVPRLVAVVEGILPVVRRHPRCAYHRALAVLVDFHPLQRSRERHRCGGGAGKPRRQRQRSAAHAEKRRH